MQKQDKRDSLTQSRGAYWVLVLLKPTTWKIQNLMMLWTLPGLVVSTKINGANKKIFDPKT